VTEDEVTEERSDRSRVILGVILALLILLLGVLSWFIVRVLAPAGAPTSGSTPAGLEWVRSIYGYGPRPDQQFEGVVHTAVAPDGTIWATDGPKARVLGFNPDGSYKGMLSHPKLLIRPSAIAIAENGEIFVGDFGSAMIDVFSPSGQLLRAFPTTAAPFQIAVKGDRVVVTTSDGIRVFTAAGKPVTKFSSRGRGPDQIDLAQGVAIGEDGTIYVADTQNSMIKAFDPAGKLLWVGPPDSQGATRSPTARGNGQLQLPAGLTIDGAGRLVFVDPFGFEIVVADPKRQGAIVARYGESGQKDGLFFYPTGLSYDPARDWFAVADTANNRVQIVRIPGSASFGMLPALRRAWTGPVWICAIPLVLLLLALAVALSGRRREEEDPETESDDDAIVNNSSSGV
jgi:DNA-binding beta-propeller fold protein YncE